MDFTFVTEFVTCFVCVWGTLVMGTLVWRHIAITRRTRVTDDQVSTVETIQARLAVEAAAVARARQRRH
jgi:mannose/fructose/N-acetylgalactosamine-specific phosphotransferase system component IID